MEPPSYHDVRVYVDGVEYAPGDNYSLQLTCTKCGGWTLYKNTFPSWGPMKTETLGSEYGDKPFCITVRDMVICGVKPDEVKKPESFGWTGGVVNEGGKVTLLKE